MTSLACGFVDGPPRVTLDVSAMPTGTATVDVVRISESGQEAPVRGAVGARVQDSSAWTGTDWDCPVDRSPVWRVTCRNAAGGVLGTATGSVQRVISDEVTPDVEPGVGIVAKPDIPPIPDCSQAWLSNPHDPSAAMLVTLMAGTDDETSHTAPMSLSQAGRTTHLPSAVMGVRVLGGSRTLVVRCWSMDEAQQFEDLLASAVTLLVRSNHDTIRHRTGCLYVVAGEVSERREWEFLDGQDETTWTLSCDEVDPGRLGVLVPPWTWADGAAYVGDQIGTLTPTWADMASVFPLWIDSTRGV